MRKSIKILIDEIDVHENINSKHIVSKFEKKIKKEINKFIVLYGDSGGLDDYTLKDIDFIILHHIWKNISMDVNLEEILIIMYSFYKLEEFYFYPSVFDTCRILDIINSSNINFLIKKYIF
tara:strand:+ start:61900 stop:62262 length:363 start_codon:yes stop_codon:yes gene_type:complete